MSSLIAFVCVVRVGTGLGDVGIRLHMCNASKWNIDCRSFDVITVKPVLSSHSKRRPKMFFKTDYRLMQVKNRMLQGEHSAIPSTFIKLPIVIKDLCFVYFRVAASDRFYCISHKWVSTWDFGTYCIFRWAYVSTQPTYQYSLHHSHRYLHT